MRYDLERMRRVLALFALSITLVAQATLAQSSNSVFGDPDDALNVVHDPQRWKSPESIVIGLRSSNEQIRLDALSLLGFSEDQAHWPVWSQTTPSRIIGSKVVAPGQIRLTYAALGDSAVQQAILAVYIEETQTASLAVAVPMDGGWQRIAFVNCACKYMTGPDVLTNFVRLEPAPKSGAESPQRFEMVLHGSGGGTGLFVQTESRFRIHKGKLSRVLSMTSVNQNCNGGTGGDKFSCTLERRWFYTIPVENSPGGVLVHGYGKFHGEDEPAAFGFLPDMNVRNLQSLRCTSFKWDEQRFRYEQVSSASNPCVANPN
jgi:hypothetical protein